MIQCIAKSKAFLNRFIHPFGGYLDQLEDFYRSLYLFSVENNFPATLERCFRNCIDFLQNKFVNDF